MVNYNLYLTKLVEYAEKNELIAARDKTWAINRLLEILGEDEYEAVECTEEMPLEEILDALVNFAIEKGLCDTGNVAHDLFDTKLMGALTPRPSEVYDKFFALYQDSPEKATDYYYKLSCATDYIRTYRIKKDMKWTTATEYGDLDITINRSKPEKDPKAIAAAKLAPQAGYPKCALCKENEGYAGRINAAARQNHRIIPIIINGSDWFMQYSPYVYYNEHCIVFNSKHTPMKIEKAAVGKLFDFVKLFPHYFVGSNADLPIVGGSILSHDHFQGGHYTFAMEKAEVEETITFKGFEDVEAGIVNWPMSVIRLRCEDTDRIADLMDKILGTWRGYTDEAAFIFAETNGEAHNTLNPIARFKNGKYELDIILRNNITTEEHPLGVYHPHAELHHIKKENIGLIEAMGLAVLPARLVGELDAVNEAMCTGADLRANPMTEAHADWAEEILAKHGRTDDREKNMVILKEEVGKVFAKVLEHAGVYKRTPEGKEAFHRFIAAVNAK